MTMIAMMLTTMMMTMGSQSGARLLTDALLLTSHRGRNNHFCDGQLLLSSRRAKRAGAKPAGVLRRRLLHRNGNFIPPAP